MKHEQAILKKSGHLTTEGKELEKTPLNGLRGISLEGFSDIKTKSP